MSNGHATSKTNWAPENRTTRRLCTIDGAMFNCTQVRLSTTFTEHAVCSVCQLVHRNDCAEAIGPDSVVRKHKWAPCQLSTSTTVHRANCARIGYAQTFWHWLDCTPLQFYTAGHTANILSILPVFLSVFCGRVLYAH